MAIKKWTNELTKECDKFLLIDDKICIAYGYHTYLWGNKNGVERNEYNYISLRVPGATRGGIKVVNDIIVDIYFDKAVCFGDMGCYKKEIESFIKDKFIGTKFDLPIVDFPMEKVK